MPTAKKSLGQNFLHDQSAIVTMVDSLQISTSDHVVEIGPGKGALTQALLATDCTVEAIEADVRMVEHLHQEFSAEIATGQLSIKHQDFLGWSPTISPYKIIGNIPFYITGAILRHVFDNLEHPTVMTLLMQKEVAERITAKNGKNSILSTACTTYARATILKKVKAGAFFPAPKVDSAIIQFNDFQQPFRAPEEQSRFFAFVRSCFAGKRKTLRSNLKSSPWREAINHLPPHVLTERAEDLTTEQINHLFIQANPHYRS